MRTAIAWTTAGAAAAVIEMVQSGALPGRGFLTQESVPLNSFLATRSGRLHAPDRRRGLPHSDAATIRGRTSNAPADANRLRLLPRTARSGRARPASRTPMTDALNASPQQQSEILMQALPHMLRYDDAIIVVKYGGHAMGDDDKARDFARDMVLLEQSGVNPVVVHGGGPQIGVDAREARHRVAFLRRPARHRQGDGRDRRDGARRRDQQADRRVDQRAGRPGDRPMRQGRQHGHRAQGVARRRRPAKTSSISALSASRTRST